MAENRKGKDEGLYYLRRGQLALLGGGFVLTSVVVFLLGVLIGQRIEERKLLKKEEPLVKIPVHPLTLGSKSEPKEEMTFYDTLSKTPSGAKGKPESSAKQAPSARKEEKSPAKEVKIIVKGDTTKSPQKIAEQLGALAKAEKGAQQQGPWAVQVNAFPTEKDANNLAKKLSEKGYEAYVVSANIKGRTWHRVRVGRLTTREEARELQETLKTKEKFTKAITVSN